MVEEALDGGLALRIGATGELAQDTQLAVLAQPLGGANNAVDTNRGRHAHVRGARVVRVEVLVHLVDELVSRVSQSDQVCVGRVPDVGARVRVALGKDVLAGGAGCADGVNGGLVEVQDQSLVHVMVLVVGIKDDIGIVLECGGNSGPE